MNCNYTIAALFLFISILTLQQCCDAIPAEQREARQAKLSNNSGVSQAEVKAFSSQPLEGGQSANQLQALPGFAGIISANPYARYGGLAYGGSGYAGSPGMGLMGTPIGGPFRVVNSGATGIGVPQFSNPAGFNYPAAANYVGNNLSPYPPNGPDVLSNYIFGGLPQTQSQFGAPLAGANNLDTLINMANLQGLTGSGNPVFGAQMQPTQLQLQGSGQASQLQLQPQPQLGGAYPYPPAFLGQMAGYGQGFQAYQVL
ncbi:uncharacterized protein LOC118743840 [Rhagoletis pomonella]|uniref:uncharacterized protein LOC118743840 n=1 Tax=Rhagoletis pomonella TaxID=28610 RepID=UPI0017831CD5|nr:uncharacterized protein LOC118743840 [Rhagoletis pomonella]